jgi:penicillin-binding protein 1C
MVGVPAFVETLRRLGFEALRSPDHYGDSLALGSADVSLWELVGAYRALAQGGAYTPLRLREVAGPEAPRRAFSPEAAYVVADVLADRAGRASAFGLESVLTTPSWSAVKTGTSVDMRDNWCVGWTRDYSVGVWIGNASGAPMWDVAGVDGAAPAWRAIVRELHRAQPSEPPAPPADLIHLAGEWYLPGSEPAPLRSAATGPPPSRIAAPAEGTLVALDPDVPAARQRLAVRAEPPDGSLAFRLDGDEIGRAGDTILWQPVRGRHALALVDAAGRTLQRVRFEVR